MSTLDTDEYLVTNPWMISKLLSSGRNSTSITNGNYDVGKSRNMILTSMLRLESGSVLRWLVNNVNSTNNIIGSDRDEYDDKDNACIEIPRLLFGSIELDNSRSDLTRGMIRLNVNGGANDNTADVVRFTRRLPRKSSTMETLRWKFHAAPNDERNFQQKVILDLNKIPTNDKMWGDHVHTVHRPSQILCRPEADDNLNGTLMVDHDGRPTSPLVAFHYIGSKERYFSRKNDVRRNPKKYRERSNITHRRDSSNWIDQWLERFVVDEGGVGLNIASSLLQDHIIDTTFDYDADVP